MKVKTYVDAKGDAPYTVYLSVNFKGKRFYVSSGLKTIGKFTGTDFPAKEPNRGTKVRSLQRTIFDIEDFEVENRNLEPDVFQRRLKEKLSGVKQPEKTLCDYFIECAASKEIGVRMRQMYDYTRSKVEEFDALATFQSVDKDWIRRWRKWLLANGISNNGVIGHYGRLKAVWHWAQEEEYTDRMLPVVRMKRDSTVKRSMTGAQLAVFLTMDVEPFAEKWRDLWYLSFLFCGMNAADLLTCKGLTNGRMVYRRHKTGHLFDLPVYNEAQEIIDRYKGRKYLLNFLEDFEARHTPERLRRMKQPYYRKLVDTWNSGLKKIGSVSFATSPATRHRSVRTYEPLYGGVTTYWARHTFATIAAELDIPRDTIAMCLGHEWADNTSIYIAPNRKKVDKAMRKVIDYVESLKLQVKGVVDGAAGS